MPFGQTPVSAPAWEATYTVPSAAMVGAALTNPLAVVGQNEACAVPVAVRPYRRPSAPPTNSASALSRTVTRAVLVIGCEDWKVKPVFSCLLYTYDAADE